MHLQKGRTCSISTFRVLDDRPPSYFCLKCFTYESVDLFVYGWTRDLVFPRSDDDYRRRDFCRVIICIHSDRIQPKLNEFKTSLPDIHVITRQPFHIEDECIYTVSGQKKLMNNLKTEI